MPSALLTKERSPAKESMPLRKPVHVEKRAAREEREGREAKVAAALAARPRNKFDKFNEKQAENERLHHEHEISIGVYGDLLAKRQAELDALARLAQGRPAEEEVKCARDMMHPAVETNPAVAAGEAAAGRAHGEGRRGYCSRRCREGPFGPPASFKLKSHTFCHSEFDS
jgi:hypothetical protein